MLEKIIGRKAEIAALKKAFESKRSEFVALYGRRRVGKTFLVKEFFNNDFTFFTTGVSKGTKTDELLAFKTSLEKYTGTKMPRLTSWMAAFGHLTALVEASNAARKVVFLDELPWMDTPKSNFLQALDYFWNHDMSGRGDVVLVVCGSATSWMMDNLIDDEGGLHNRLTDWLQLDPFTLKECRQYFDARHISLTDRQIAEYYMIMGGVPFYLDFISGEMSLNSNIDTLFFHRTGKLREEFDHLYAALFKKSQDYIKVVKAIYSKSMGVSRDEIIARSKLKSGEALTDILKNLERCGFIRSYRNYSSTKNNKLYQLIDPYTIFYLKYIDSELYTDETYWTDSANSPERNSWAGYAFEILCLNHQRQMLKALGISGVPYSISSWRTDPKKDKEDGLKGAQIDLVISRRDGYIHICEMKFSRSEYEITKAYSQNLQNKVERFILDTKCEDAIILTFITSCGVKQNAYSYLAQRSITLEDLFE